MISLLRGLNFDIFPLFLSVLERPVKKWEEVLPVWVRRPIETCGKKKRTENITTVNHHLCRSLYFVYLWLFNVGLQKKTKHMKKMFPIVPNRFQIVGMLLSGGRQAKLKIQPIRAIRRALCCHGNRKALKTATGQSVMFRRQDSKRPQAGSIARNGKNEKESAA